MTQAAPTARTIPARTDRLPPEPHRPPYLWAFVASAALFALYALTLAPTTAFWDTSEYIATAHILGIPHPPGNPTFVLLAKAWSLLLEPTGLPVAVRINLFSAFMTAGASFFWFLVVHRILSAFTASVLVRRVGAAAAVVIAGTAYTVWAQSNVNEKVYTVTLFTVAAVSWIAFLWRDHVEAHAGQRNARWRDDNAILLVLFLLALSAGNHLMVMLAGPALLVFLLLVKWRVLLRPMLYPLAAGVFILGLSVQLFLPMRANQDPVINEASPKCESVAASMAAVFTFGRLGADECPALTSSLRREQYDKPPLGERQAPFGAQMANFFQYFDWQWSRMVAGTDGYLPAARMPFTFLFLVLGIWGAIENYRRDRKSFWYMATLFFTLSFGLVYYMNFKYGYMQGQEIGQPNTEVRERDYFYILTFSVWGLWAGVGLTAMWLWLADVVGQGRRRALAYASPVLALALIPLALNWKYATRSGDYAARDFAYNLLQSVEPYGVLITNGDNDTFPLWYLQEVEGIRRDVTVIVMSYFNTPWYAQQLRDLTRPCPTPGAAAADPTRIICQRPFIPEQSPHLRAPAQPPSSSILPLTDTQIQQIAATYPFLATAEHSFQARGQTFGLMPDAVIQPAHTFVTMMLQNVWGERPIHFAATTNTHYELGMLTSTTRQGLSFKAVTPDEAAGLTQMPMDPNILQFTGGYYDVDYNRQLADSVFMFRNMPERAVWQDDATRNIPMQYFYSLGSLSAAAQLAGDTAAAQEYAERAEAFQELARER